MPVQPFGRADPQYDALRVFSGIATDDTSSGAGGGLLNRIYLWPGDGSTISDYAPDQAGLIAALAATSINGDTVWLPSIGIILTTGITLGAGVTLIGMDENSRLTFGGFSGTAITMATGATCKNFSIYFVSNGTDALGIDARFTNALIDGVSVTVSGGSSSNVAIYMGAPE